MTTDEILNLYKFAKDPTAEVVILSQLTAKPVEKIISIIREAGYAVDETKIPRSARNARFPWTADEDKQLVELKTKGLTYAQISNIMSRTSHSLKDRFGKINRGVISV